MSERNISIPELNNSHLADFTWIGLIVRFSPLKWLLWMGLLLSAEVTFAKPWQAEPGVLDQDTLRKLKDKVPSIDTLSDAQSLLSMVAILTPLAKAELIDRGSHFELMVAVGSRIVAVEIETLTRTFRAALESSARAYIGQVDSAEVREKILEKIRNYLRSRGFPLSRTKLSTSKNRNGTVYRIDVDYGYPCLIESINFSFGLPKYIQFDVEPGDICDEEAINAALREVEDELKEESYAQASIDTPKYIYNTRSNTAKLLVRGTIGNRVEYKIIDDRNDFLGSLLGGDELNELSPATIPPEALAADLRQRYRDKGFDDVEVSGPLKVSNNDLDVYTYKIRTGPRYEIESIKFQGNTAFSSDELRDFLGLSTFWQTDPHLSVNLIERGLEVIKSEYRKKGYWDAEITEPRITKNRDTGRAQVTIIIEEGMQRKLTGIRVRKARFLTAEDVEEVTDLRPGDALDQTRLVNLENEIRKRYLERGYLYTKVDISLEMRRGLKTIYSTLVVTVDEGPRVRIGEISIQGLYETEEKVARRELHFEKGDWYDPETIDASRRALLRLGIFSSVQILPADRDALSDPRDTLDLIILVREAKPGNVAFGPGWSNFRGMRFNIESSYNNIGGQGRQVTGRVFLSEDANQRAIGRKTLIGRSVNVGYLEPYIFDTPINGTASLYNSARANETWILTQGGEVALSHRLRGFLVGSTVSLFYGQKINREESSDEQKQGYLRLLGGGVRTGRAGVRYTYDFRDDITWPTAGGMVGGEVSRAAFPLIGNLSYKHWKIGYNQYVGITNKLVFAFGTSLQAFQDVNRKGSQADVLPQSETLFVGGADTVRGFQFRSLGPRIAFDEIDENGDPTGERIRNEELGGSHSAVFKLELRRRLFGDFALTTFVDAGNVFFSSQEVQDFDRRENVLNAGQVSSPARIEDNVPYQFEDLLTNPEYIWTKNYTSYGLAVNYLTPLGSINLSYGLPWKRCADEGRACIERGKQEAHWLLNGVVHFNIGATF